MSVCLRHTRQTICQICSFHFILWGENIWKNKSEAGCKTWSVFRELCHAAAAAGARRINGARCCHPVANCHMPQCANRTLGRTSRCVKPRTSSQLMKGFRVRLIHAKMPRGEDEAAATATRSNTHFLLCSLLGSREKILKNTLGLSSERWMFDVF